MNPNDRFARSQPSRKSERRQHSLVADLVTIRRQMSILEASRILQPVAQHPVEADVGNPEQCDRHELSVSSQNKIPNEQQRPHVGVNCIVRGCAETNAAEVAEHRQIRRQEKDREKQPASALPMVGQEADDQAGAAFQKEKRSRGHSLFYAAALIKWPQRLSAAEIT